MTVLLIKVHIVYFLLSNAKKIEEIKIHILLDLFTADLNTFA